MVPTNNAGIIVSRARSRLTDMFRNQPNMVAMQAAMLVGFPEVENQFWAIINSRILSNNPTGDQLDIIGPLVGEIRQGRSDASYLQAIQIRIRVNRSQGTAEDVIQVANLIFPASTYSEFPTMKWLVQAWNLPDPLGFKRLLASTKATASRGSVYYSFGWPVADNLVAYSRYSTPPVGYQAFTSRYSTPANAGLAVASVNVDKN